MIRLPLTIPYAPAELAVERVPVPILEFGMDLGVRKVLASGSKLLTATLGSATPESFRSMYERINMDTYIPAYMHACMHACMQTVSQSVSQSVRQTCILKIFAHTYINYTEKAWLSHAQGRMA